MKSVLFLQVFMAIILFKLWRNYCAKNSNNTFMKGRFSKLALLNIGILVFETIRISSSNVFIIKLTMSAVILLLVLTGIFILNLVKHETRYRERIAWLYKTEAFLSGIAVIAIIIYFTLIDVDKLQKIYNSKHFLMPFLAMFIIETIQVLRYGVEREPKKVIITLCIGFIIDICVREISLLPTVMMVLLVDVYIFETSKNLDQDCLTGLKNRRFLQTEAIRIFTGKATALLFIDIDKFKKVNDDFGHHMGDKVLCDVAEILQASARSEDYCIRYAGDEFVILAKADNDETTGAIIKERILSNLSMYNKNNHQLPVYLSIGTLYLVDGINIELELEKADKLMYEEKRKHHEEGTLNTI